MKQASIGIKDLGSQASSRSYQTNNRQKRAISQDYTFDPDLQEDFTKPMMKSGEIRRRKFKHTIMKQSGNNSFIRPKHGSLSEAGSSIMNMSGNINNTMIHEDLNISMMPNSHYSESKKKVCFNFISKCYNALWLFANRLRSHLNIKVNQF